MTAAEGSARPVQRACDERLMFHPRNGRCSTAGPPPTAATGPEDGVETSSDLRFPHLAWSLYRRRRVRASWRRGLLSSSLILSSSSRSEGAPLHPSKTQPARSPRNERATIKLSLHLFLKKRHHFTFTSSGGREDRPERTGSFGVRVALEGGSDGSPGESSVGFPDSHRGK